VVGVNDFTVTEETPIRTQRVDPIVERKEIDQLAALKKERDNQKVRSAIDRLRNKAEKDENLMPPILDAVRAYTTLGEICDCLREVYGEYLAPSIF
jgi:methylmalonyl-CoA mutase N-terminal domain/subunit